MKPTRRLSLSIAATIPPMRKYVTVQSVLVICATFCLGLPRPAEAKSVTLGEIVLTGGFTIYNGVYPQNALGIFQDMEVQTSTGIFAPHVSTGDALQMSSPYMVYSQPMSWSVGGYSFDTPSYEFSVAGAPQAGQIAISHFALSGNGFDPSDYPLGINSFWHFLFPPYDHQSPPETFGPITMTIHVGYEDGLPRIAPISLFALDWNAVTPDTLVNILTLNELQYFSHFVTSPWLMKSCVFRIVAVPGDILIVLSSSENPFKSSSIFV